MEITALTPKRQGSIVLLVTLLLTSFVVGMLLMLVWHRVQVVELGYEMTHLTHQHQELLEQRERLRIELSVQRRTEWVDKTAREQGLQLPAPGQVIEVKPLRTASHR